MSKDIELAILFADVVGSTHIYEVMGDERARDMILRCVDVMRHATEGHEGTVIKTIGDEVMATFPSADSALNAASEMQHEIRSNSVLKVDGQPIAIRIGCHYGPVMLEQRDIFGAAVHTANRMTSQAKAGQIMISGAMVQRLAPEWRSSVRQIDVAMLKGKSSEDELYEVLWMKEDATSMLPALALGGILRDKLKPARLVLSYMGQEFVVNGARNSMTIGRAEENDIVIKGNLISRLHARIEFNRNKFMLVDQSTNGTFVTADSGEEAFVRRDSVQLKGKGVIGLGRTAETSGVQVVKFHCDD